MLPIQSLALSTMKESRSKDKHGKTRKEKTAKGKYRKEKSSSSSSTDSDEWVEKKISQANSLNSERDGWMSMTGKLKTFTKDDIKPRKEEKNKNHIDSYNPSTSCRELNPYWKDGGTGLPQSPESFRKSKPYLKPSDDDDYYSKSSTTKEFRTTSSSKSDKRSKAYEDYNKYSQNRSSNWKKQSDSNSEKRESNRNYNEDMKYPKSGASHTVVTTESGNTSSGTVAENQEGKKKSLYLSDEKMNKLGAKIIKAEIMGDTKLVTELKTKLEAAREYRKQNPDCNEEDEGVMLIATNSSGNSRPLIKHEKGDPRSKGGKRKAETHSSGERMKYFGNDDKYDLAQMFQEEKYGNNYNDEAQLAKIASKHKNPNDDLEDIFMDDISKNRNEAKDSEKERQLAVNQHIRMERSLDGCEYCIDSKNMLKHLMVSCGSKVYVALPAKKSLVTGQCLITTIQHTTCVTALDEDIWEEILVYRNALTQFFNSQDKDVVFFETATRLHRFPHMVINCVPLRRDVGDLAAIYFKKALLECEAEWSMNKKVVELKGKNIRKGIPKGLPYFWIDFGMDPGFAHVIEDQKLFPKTFAEEVIAGILDLDHHLWKNPRKEYGDVQRKKVLDFIKEWKSFEPNQNKN